jgi:hypothetical protein
MLDSSTAKGLSLEELDTVFEVPTGQFIKYQNSKVFPHWFKTTILRQKGLYLEPLVVQGHKARA